MTSNSDNRISRRFEPSVSPGGSEELTAEVEADATVEKIEVRFYDGPRLDLGVMPFVRRYERSDRSRRQDAVDVHGSDYVRGENDHWPFFVSETVEEGDEIGVEVVNDDEEHRYDAVVNFELDRVGGSSRPLKGFLTTVRSWF
jgi:hypothetical protein